ncbi:type II toxin-antitoxin system prevent-host-death family antitoxin [Enterobacter cloacae]|uniref:type II toxin-antitoxin system Phd/YefM family antitoxin n=1 Tax=Enterobacter cloacae TaxID=550 RepID=UPI00300EB516
MRKVSYTQMRAELSDILDAIRNGETVVVTQRGRPDTVLNGSVDYEKKIHITTGKKYTIQVTKTPSGETCYVTKKPNGEVVTSIHKNTERVSFKDALVKTQRKHAKIIKALEDK